MASTSGTILLVEDDPIVSSLVSALLQREGYRTEAVQDAVAALERVQAGGVDLVLLDIGLPGMNGFELCRRLRAREGEIHLPILMLTGFVSDDDRHAGFAAGADDYLTKPVKQQDLLDRIRVWIRTRRYLQNASQHPRAPSNGTDQQLLRLALSTTNDLTRLLMLLLRLLEDWDAHQRSPAELRELRREFQHAAAALAARINTITRRAQPPPQD
jgi:DNA-binding response OmpR family regulator